MRHALDEPPRLGTADYEQALRQVRAKGIKPELMGTLAAANPRDVNETLIGVYWGYDGAAGLGTPPRLYNQIIREVATKTPNPANGGAVNTPALNARLFALGNVAMADAGILAWEQKYKWADIIPMPAFHSCKMVLPRLPAFNSEAIWGRSTRVLQGGPVMALAPFATKRPRQV
jgi:hypothetical protein